MHHSNKNSSRSANRTIGRILVADDEKTFLTSTAQLLRNEGFECDCAEDAEQTLEQLSKNSYDLLIADIKMPGNSNLELIKRLPDIAAGLSVILITGYPSQQTAVDAVHLPVAAYLVKPLDFQQLLQKTKAAVKAGRLYKLVVQTRQNLQQWINELDTMQLSLQSGKCDEFETVLKSFLDIVAAKIDYALSSIRQATDLLDSLKPDEQICRVMPCPAFDELTDGLEQAIKSLRKSRDLYKSKQLAKIRMKLEKLLKEIQKN